MALYVRLPRTFLASNLPNRHFWQGCINGFLAKTCAGYANIGPDGAPGGHFVCHKAGLQREPYTFTVCSHLLSHSLSFAAKLTESSLYRYEASISIRLQNPGLPLVPRLVTYSVFLLRGSKISY